MLAAGAGLAGFNPGHSLAQTQGQAKLRRGSRRRLRIRAAEFWRADSRRRGAWAGWWGGRGGPAAGGAARRGFGGGSAVRLAGRFRWEAPSMSDPFIYADEKSHSYYLTGSGGRLYKSADLKMWSPVAGPITDLSERG